MTLFCQRLTRLILLMCIGAMSLNCFATDKPSADDFAALFAAPTDIVTVTKIMQQLRLNQSSRGDFEQTRWLKVLKKPLTSHGQFIFAPQAGVYWHQQQPFVTTLILSNNTLTQIDSQGNVSQQHADDSPSSIAAMMPKLLQALLSADIDFLQHHFQITLQQHQSRWQLGLIATDPQLKSMLPRVVLSGTTSLERVLLLGQQQDVTEILLSDVTQGPLSETEQQRFENGAKH